MSTAREHVLGMIRNALGDERARLRVRDRGEADPRAYRKSGTRSGTDLLNLLADRVEAYEASVFRCSLGELPGLVAARLRERRIESLVIPSDLPPAWTAGVPPGAPKVLPDQVSARLSREDLAAADGVLSGCFLAVAETGTLVLNGGVAQGRRALTLLPDYHLCVVFQKQVVETVPEAVAAMGEVVREDQPPVTLISGPSATSDIELIRVEGVHGPRTLDVILVEES